MESNLLREKEALDQDMQAAASEVASAHLFGSLTVRMPRCLVDLVQQEGSAWFWAQGLVRRTVKRESGWQVQSLEEQLSSAAANAKARCAAFCPTIHVSSSFFYPSLGICHMRRALVPRSLGQRSLCVPHVVFMLDPAT